MSVYIPSPLGAEAEQPIVYSERSVVDIDDARKILHTYSSVSQFEDEQWIIDKANEDQNLTDKLRTISFLKISNVENRNTLKIAAVMRLMKRYSTRVVAHMVWIVREFLTVTQSENVEFASITPEAIFAYNNYLFHSGLKTALKNRLGKWFLVKDFFKTNGFQRQYSLMDQYITDTFPDKRRVDEKLIPEDVARRLDVEFLKDDIPLPFKVIYWTLRLLPNRIHEALSMKMNCLKQLDTEYYMVSIPTFKQTGPYRLGNIKLIEIKYSGIGQYYIDLLRSFIQQRKKESYSADDDFLFYSYRYLLMRDKDGEYHYSCGKAAYTPLTIDRVNYFFKHLCRSRNIMTEDGKPYNVTSHQFRHNATSERINSGIFRSIDIQGLTYHHSTAMIEQTYTHQDVNAMADTGAVIFKGRVINTNDDRKINQFLKRPYAKSIYKLGICSDVRSCDEDKSKCLRCKYMIPDADDLDYYEKELQDWKSKKLAAERIGNNIYADLCTDWIASYETVINRVLKALTNEDVGKDGGIEDEAAK